MPTQTKDPPHKTQNTAFKTLTLDVDRYQALLDYPELTEDQRTQFLVTLWSIMVQLVDWGYGIHPVQQVPGSDAGDLAGSEALIASLFEDVASPETSDSPTNQKEMEEEGAAL
ncbi:MAG: hypothetical protein AAF739_01485 [Pseudomonadota bacterium]